MIVGPVELLVELDHQAFEERWELPLLLAGLKTQETMIAECSFAPSAVSVCSCIVRLWLHRGRGTKRLSRKGCCNSPALPPSIRLSLFAQRDPPFHFIRFLFSVRAPTHAWTSNPEGGTLEEEEEVEPLPTGPASFSEVSVRGMFQAWRQLGRGAL